MIRIRATYAATDGSAPEDIEIEWDDAATPPTAGDLRFLVEALANVPHRYEIRVEKSEPKQADALIKDLRVRGGVTNA